MAPDRSPVRISTPKLSPAAASALLAAGCGRQSKAPTRCCDSCFCCTTLRAAHPMVDSRPDGTGGVRSCGCFWTTLVLGAMLGAAVFVSTDLREKPLRHRGRSASALDRKPSRTSPRSLHDRLNRTHQRSPFFSPRKERNHEQARAVRANRPVDETVVDASGGPFSSYGPSTCRSSQSAVCKRCVAASSGPRAARALAVGPAHGRLR